MNEVSQSSLWYLCESMAAALCSSVWISKHVCIRASIKHCNVKFQSTIQRNMIHHFISMLNYCLPLLFFPDAGVWGFFNGLPKSRYRWSESALPAEELDELLDRELPELDLDRDDDILFRLLERDLLDSELLLALFGRGLMQKKISLKLELQLMKLYIRMKSVCSRLCMWK